MPYKPQNRQSAWAYRAAHAARPRRRGDRVGPLCSRSVLHLLTSAHIHRSIAGQSTTALPGISDVDLLCDLKGVVDLDAQVAHRTLNFLVPEQKLHCAQVARASVDQSGFGPPLIPISE